MACLYLIPSMLGENDPDFVFPEKNFKLINSLDCFIVEKLRTARRFLRSVGYKKNFDNIEMFELNKHTQSTEIEKMISPLLNGVDTGLISEAGAPAVADPGSELVLMAHRKNINVVPLIGPSSILLALMSSGLNGQRFAFHGYLPVKKNERIKAIRELEKRSQQNKETQIFMETPYRNMKLLEDIIENAKHSTLLCIASDISLNTEFIKTKTIIEWSACIPNIHKRPTIFLIHTF